MSKEISPVLQKEDQELISSSEINRQIIQALENLSTPGKSLLVVCEDNTRSTPIDSFFPQLLNDLHSLGLKITVLFALGTHRPMSLEEMYQKLGLSAKQLKEVNLINHNAYSEEELTTVGEIEGKTLKINKAILDADIVLTLSSVLPHRIVGFSGGGKMLSPGISNKEFIDYSHWRSTTFDENVISGEINNPMRTFIDQATNLVTGTYPNKTFICVSFISVPAGICNMSIGSFKESFEAAAKRSQEVFIQEVEECNSILAVVDDKCTDFWQAAKAIYNCARALRKGGTIVIYGKLPDGISATHEKDILDHGYVSREEIKKLYENNLITNQVAASHMIRVSEYASRVKIFLSSESISEETCRRAKLGYIHPSELPLHEFDLVIHHATDIFLRVKPSSKEKKLPQ